ncbi:FeGP cofactor biosynthesis guanylyltransferase HcgB family protein [Desulfurobacterium atlanticum]|uniref:Uncharacterized protein n=1 Tax=Desulfurobacterium atlanticum TaxID=240169 RepID=A0A239A665_9BACT|nr:FeGP cofactor biosynthesis guanylyltransferase HcgB family protein [Desulfurobacterium atlanticum]SNR90383.1 hypothetical protein SAMN06265340_11514 [Desulfurobacterium atlanticum]
MSENLYPFKKGFLESISGNRKGDKKEETAAIKKLILNSKIGIVTDNVEKFKAFKHALSMFGIKKVEKISIPTEYFDLTQIPALSKALSGKYVSDCELFIARGRLGLPGSGAFTVIVDRYSNILSAVSSPPHHFHRLSTETAIFLDTINLLKRVGITPSHRGITRKTKTVYSNLSFLDIAREISRKKAETLKNFRGKNLLIVGGYLDGIFIGEFLKKNFENIFLIDKEKEVEKISPFKKPCGKTVFDLIIDLTGFGGAKVNRRKVEGFKGKIVICEEPSADMLLPAEKEADFKIKLKSENYKTSGTMTLSVKIARKTADRIEEENGVLYAVPNLLFSENILFNFKNGNSFLEITTMFPVITVSCVSNAEVDGNYIDKVINQTIEELKFELVSV